MSAQTKVKNANHECGGNLNEGETAVNECGGWAFNEGETVANECGG